MQQRVHNPKIAASDERHLAMTQFPETIDHILGILEKRPDAPAVIVHDSDARHVWTNQQISQRVHRLAAGLLERGLSPGDRVALVSDTSAEAVTVALATMAAGGMIVPLDVQFEEDILADVLRDIDPQMLFASSKYRAQAEACLEGSECEVVLLDDTSQARKQWESLLNDPPEEWPQPRPDAAAVLFYTSGTTGPPKGVPLYVVP